MTGGQHSSKGAQGITKEARWQGRLYPAAVGGFRFALAAGQVVLTASRKQVPAVLHQLQAG